MELSTKQFSYNADDRCFAAEVSELGFGPGQGIPMEVTLRNPDTRRSWTFRHYHTDKDASGEDIYGWRFRAAEDRNFTLLIIND